MRIDQSSDNNGGWQLIYPVIGNPGLMETMSLHGVRNGDTFLIDTVDDAWGTVGWVYRGSVGQQEDDGEVEISVQL